MLEDVVIRIEMRAEDDKAIEVVGFQQVSQPFGRRARRCCPVSRVAYMLTDLDAIHFTDRQDLALAVSPGNRITELRMDPQSIVIDR